MVEIIRQACQRGLAAGRALDQILANVAVSKGGTPLPDDMGCVVLKVERAKITNQLIGASPNFATKSSMSAHNATFLRQFEAFVSPSSRVG